MPSWIVTLIAVLSVTVVLVACTLVYRRVLPSEPATLTALLVGVVGVIAWLGFYALVRPVILTELVAPIAALGALAAFLATIVVRVAGATRAGAVVFALVWSAAVFAPTAVVAFTGLGPFGIRPIDQGGSLAVNVAAGAAALGVLIVAAPRTPRAVSAQPSQWAAGLGMVALILGWLGWLVGAELAINDRAPLILVTGVLSAAGGVVGWLLVQRIRHQSTTLGAVAAGLISGVVGVTAGAPFYAPPAAFVAGVLAGVFASLVTLRAVGGGGRAQWFIVGAHFIAGAVGLIVLALLAGDLGFFFTGQYVFLRDQVVSIFLVGVYSLAVSMGLWWVMRRIPALVRPALA
ncbi:MAG: ammonium transporter [Microbacteriaceae bacterium]|nr:ammonium transporter [Microbacteriaceae bacterium]